MNESFCGNLKERWCSLKENLEIILQAMRIWGFSDQQFLDLISHLEKVHFGQTGPQFGFGLVKEKKRKRTALEEPHETDTADEAAW